MRDSHGHADDILDRRRAISNTNQEYTRYIALSDRTSLINRLDDVGRRLYANATSIGLTFNSVVENVFEI